MNEKTLFMHAGGSKTGSSAIQDFLELNTTKLENLGYAYQNRANIEHNHISSANGEILFKTLFSLISTDNEVDRLLLSFFGEQNNAICSSELFQHLTDQGWKNLFFSLDRLNIKVKIIFFIRNVISFLNSAYDQMIKGHGEVRPLDQFYLEEEWYHITALRNMITIFPKGNIKVLHYDSLKTNLIESFLDVVLDVNLLEFSHEELHKKVNRSLTTEERDILLKVNSAIGDIYSFELSSLLIYSNPNPNPDCQPIVVKKDIYELVRERYEDDINWVNDIFFKGQSIVSCIPIELSKSSFNTNQRIKEVPENNLTNQVLEWALKKLSILEDEFDEKLMGELNNLSIVDQLHDGKTYPDVPDDFDPVTYLLINRDVLRSRMDPITHYILYGKNEGRTYCYLNKSDQLQVNTSQ